MTQWGLYRSVKVWRMCCSAVEGTYPPFESLSPQRSSLFWMPEPQDLEHWNRVQAGRTILENEVCECVCVCVRVYIALSQNPNHSAFWELRLFSVFDLASVVMQTPGWADEWCHHPSPVSHGPLSSVPSWHHDFYYWEGNSFTIQTLCIGSSTWSLYSSSPATDFGLLQARKITPLLWKWTCLRLNCG